MDKRTNPAKKLGRAACSVVLAIGLCWPCELAFLDKAFAVEEAPAVQDGSKSATAVGPEPENVSSAAATEADSGSSVENGAAVSGNKGDEVAAQEGIAEQSDAERILDAARAAELEGIEALEKYLVGEDELTDEELLSIDVEGLKEIDAELSDEIALLQDDARARQEAAGNDDEAGEGGNGAIEGEDGEPADPSTGDGEAADEPVEGNPSSDGAAQQADDADIVDSERKAGDKTEQASQSPQHPAWSYSGDTSYTPRNYSVSLTTVKFIAVIGEPSRKLAAEHDLYASIMIAQAILESGSGGSGLSQPPYFNLFGIKGSYRGQSVTMSTQEDDGTGACYTIRSAFRSYPSYRESLADYADLLSRDYYAPARKSATQSYVDACDYLQGTYATSTSYSASLQGIIDAYDLTRYDEPLGYELVDAYKAVVDTETGNVLAWGEEGIAEYADILADEEQDEVVVEERGLVDLTMYASCKLGLPYIWGGTGPEGYDCSGLVQTSYASALGIVIPRTTHYQCLIGEDVDFKDLHAGDMVFFADGEGVVGHVGMYLGEGCYIESTTGGVQVTALDERTPTFAKRVLPTRKAEAGTGPEALGSLRSVDLSRDAFRMSRSSSRLSADLFVFDGVRSTELQARGAASRFQVRGGRF